MSPLEAQVQKSGSISRFAERCVRDAYDPSYVHDIIYETYRVLHNSIDDEPVSSEEKEHAKQEIREEYQCLLEDLPCFADNSQQPREIFAYEEGIALGNWSRGINEAYKKLAGEVVQETGIDPLYDPRSVFDNIGL